MSMITYDEAETLAQKLKASSQKIVGVELFGSVLKNGRGRDADFVILTNQALAKRCWHDERATHRVRWPEELYGYRWLVKKFTPLLYSLSTRTRRQKRLETAAILLGIDLETLKGKDGGMLDFEMFLMPVDWRTGISLNEPVIKEVTGLCNDKNTLGFLKRIAKEARKIA